MSSCSPRTSLCSSSSAAPTPLSPTPRRVSLKLGGRNLLIANARDLPAMVKELKRTPFSAITGVNTLYNALLDRADFAALGFSGLKLAIAGGMAVQRAVAERWQRLTGM